MDMDLSDPGYPVAMGHPYPYEWNISIDISAVCNYSFKTGGFRERHRSGIIAWSGNSNMDVPVGNSNLKISNLKISNLK